MHEAKLVVLVKLSRLTGNARVEGFLSGNVCSKRLVFVDDRNNLYCCHQVWLNYARFVEYFLLVLRGSPYVSVQSVMFL